MIDKISIAVLIVSIFIFVFYLFWPPLKEKRITKAIFRVIANFISKLTYPAILTATVRNMMSIGARLISRVSPVSVRFFKWVWAIYKTLGGNMMTIISRSLRRMRIVVITLLALILRACKIFARTMKTTGAEFRKSGLPACKSFGKKAWDFIDKKPRDLSLVLVWVVLTAMLWKPLFGNQVSRDGWSNAFSEPTGFIVYITITLATLLLLIGGIRHGKKITVKWRKRAQYATVALMIVGGLGYFIYFTAQDSGKEKEVYVQQSAPLTQHATPQPTPFSAAQHGIPLFADGTPAYTQAPSAPIVVTATLTGTEKLGVKVFDLAPGERAVVEEISRDHYSLEADGSRQYTSLWGYNDNKLANYWDGRWRPNHRYSYIKGIMAGETLILLGEVGSAKNIIQFPDGEKRIEVRNATNETVSLTLYFHGLEEYWTDNSPYAFVDKNEADKYGHTNTSYKKGFDPNYQKGSATFKAEKIS